ncbi:MAG: ATP-binding protein [Cyclobacteriaceae bacterium]
MAALDQFPAVAILGPRQVGKTTLALSIAASLSPPPTYLDLQSPTDVAKLSEPELYLESHTDRTVILDEIQRMPEFFSILLGVIDKRKRAGQRAGQFIILGSASLDLLRQSSETLAGRIAYVLLPGLQIDELSPGELPSLWLRGGFPDSFLAPDEEKSLLWRQNFIQTYLERDVPQFGMRVPASTLRNFWTMLAHANGGLLNLSKLAMGISMSVPSATRYLDLLEDLFLVRKLHPWSINTGKRLVKSPKVYIRDSGILHALLKIQTVDDLLGHPVVGSSWEGFVIETILSDLPPWVSPSFYRTAAGAEIDLVLEGRNKQRIAIEIKRTGAPALTKGFLIGCEDVMATERYFVYSGKERFSLSRDTVVVPVHQISHELKSKF